MLSIVVEKSVEASLCDSSDDFMSINEFLARSIERAMMRVALVQSASES